VSSEAGRRTRAAIERVLVLARERRVEPDRASRRRAYVIDQARGGRVAAARLAAKRLGTQER
jgi:hypothetical protein